MKTPDKSHVYIVRHALLKGEGAWPKAHEMTEEEKQNPRLMCTINAFIAEIDPYLLPELLEVEVLYDGMADHALFGPGLFFHTEEEEVRGYPAPILAYRFKTQIDPEVVLEAVRELSVTIRPSLRDPEEDSYWSEDWNGYSQILAPEKEAILISTLKSDDIYAGWIVAPEDMEDIPMVRSEAIDSGAK